MMNKKIPSKEKIEKMKQKDEEETKVLNRLMRKPRNLGERAADSLAVVAGSWKFIFLLFLFILIWMIYNIYQLLFVPFDPYPFILLNLMLSCLAAVQAPIILMTQNRQESRDRFKNELDYRVDKKAELEIQDIQRDLEEIKNLLKK